MTRKLRRWRDLFRRRTLDTQFDAELSFHIEQLVQELTREGLSPAEARRRATLEFGGPEQMKEQLRDVHRMRIIDSTAANLKSAYRFIRRSPAFAAALVLTLALGIGANSAIMSAIDAILLRPLPFPEADRLVSIHQHNQDGKGPEVFVAPIRLEDWNRLNSTFQAMSGYYIDDGTESSGELPEKITIAFIAPRFFQVWGIAPIAGREFAPDELRAGGPNAVVISERYARRRFGSAANAIGRTLRLGGQSTVVGVMPESFDVPARDVDIWAPVPVDMPLTQRRDLTWYRVAGRLKAGITPQQARADLATVQAQLGKQFPKTDADTTVAVRQVKEEAVGGVRRSLWMLFGAVSLLLLIACTNVSALLLARTADREQEIATRFALGASRGTVVGQLLTETLVLALAGAAAGMAVVWVAERSFQALAGELPRIHEIAIDWRVLLYTLVCAIAATIASGLLPALRFTRRSLSSGIAQGGRGQVSRGTTVQWVLVGVQVALAVVLLAGAGLLLRTFRELGRVAPGFETAHVLTFHISGSYAETVNYPALMSRIDRTLDALRQTPGIEAAATSLLLPGLGGLPRAELKVGEERETDRRFSADVRFVSNGYFDTMRIPIMRGEACRESATSDTVVVNNSFAKSYLGGRSPIGYHLRVDGRGLNLAPSRIIGVSADAREIGIDKAPVPAAYWCSNAPTPSPYYLVRTHGDPAAMGEVIRRKIHEIEPARSVFDITPLDTHLYEAFGERRLRAVLLSSFALTAVLLACIGVYGTLTYVVAVRRKEVGLRIALGARRSEIVRRFLVRGLTVSIAGCAAGLCLAAMLTRVLEGMLYGVAATDPETFACVLASVVAVSALASLWPALRAARVDPMRVLHEQ